MSTQFADYIRWANQYATVAIDPDFASFYGPTLAARQARFLGDSTNEAWRIWGKWVRSYMGELNAPWVFEQASAHEDWESVMQGDSRWDLVESLVNVMEAGVFFDCDLISVVLLPLALQYEPVYQSLLKPGISASSLRLLWVKPHVNDLYALFLSPFPTCAEERTGWGRCLWLLFRFMSPPEKRLAAVQLALMVEQLDGHCWDGDSFNVAVLFYNETGLLPAHSVGKLLTYLLTLPLEAHCLRAHVLHTVSTFADRRALRECLVQVHDDDLKGLVAYVVASMDKTIVCECLDSILTMLKDAHRRVGIATLRLMCTHIVKGCGKDDGGTDGSVMAKFEGVCQLSLGQADCSELIRLTKQMYM